MFTLVLVFSYITIITTGIVAVLNARYKTKDDKNNLTRTGKILVFILFFLVVAQLFLQVFKDIDSTNSKKNAERDKHRADSLQSVIIHKSDSTKVVVDTTLNRAIAILEKVQSLQKLVSKVDSTSLRLNDVYENLNTFSDSSEIRNRKNTDRLQMITNGLDKSLSGQKKVATELDKLSYPISSLEMHFVLALHLQSPEDKELKEQLREFARSNKFERYRKPRFYWCFSNNIEELLKKTGQYSKYFSQVSSTIRFYEMQSHELISDYDFKVPVCTRELKFDYVFDTLYAYLRQSITRFDNKTGENLNSFNSSFVEITIGSGYPFIPKTNAESVTLKGKVILSFGNKTLKLKVSDLKMTRELNFSTLYFLRCVQTLDGNHFKNLELPNIKDECGVVTMQ